MSLIGLEMSLCAEQTTSYFPGVHGLLVAWSVFLIATLILLNTPFVAFYNINIVVYISYVIDASRGVPKVITDGTHAPPISVKIVGEPHYNFTRLYIRYREKFSRIQRIQSINKQTEYDNLVLEQDILSKKKSLSTVT